MYVVVADDLSGAAETGGVAVRYGLIAEVALDEIPESRPQALIVDTNTRSLPGRDAAERIVALGPALEQIRKLRLFKKVDSVLRGPVAAEAAALMEAAGKARALLVPANPGMGRVIRDGRYWMGGRPVEETDFRFDPEHPVRTSDVVKMAGAAPAGAPVTVRKPGEPLPEKGIVIGEAASAEDLETWAKACDERTLAGGAAEFFAAYLEAKGHARAPAGETAMAPEERILILSGSASAVSREQLRELRRRGIPLVEMPPELYPAAGRVDPIIHEWALSVAYTFRRTGRVIAAIGRPPLPGQPRAARFAAYLAEMAAQVLERYPARHIWVEGGATAAALVRRLRWKRLEVVEELRPGVVRLRPSGQETPLIVVKPGSYDWLELLGAAVAKEDHTARRG